METLFSPLVVNLIQKIKIPLSEEQDQQVWAASSTGQLTVKFAYRHDKRVLRTSCGDQWKNLGAVVEGRPSQST